MIGFCENPQHRENEFISAFNDDTNKFISNVTTELKALCVDELIFPVTINNEEYDSSYVCSPYTVCISYSKEEMYKLGNKPLEMILNAIISSVASLLKAVHINKVVSVNNYLLSTNLYPNWQGENLQKITDYLLQMYPKHTIMFRSLNHCTNAELLQKFVANGYILFPSRQVYIFDKRNHDYLKHQNTQRDLKLLQKTPYTIIDNHEITEKDYPRIVALYNLLYLEKYSYHNPQFTEECIKLWHRSGFIYLQALKSSDGKIDGVIGYFEKNKVITAPIVGYDTHRDKKEGLYRILMALAISRAHSRDLLLNLSSGASSFKMLRGGQPYIEYSAIYIKHLPFAYRLVWKMMRALFQYIGVPLLKKYKL